MYYIIVIFVHWIKPYVNVRRHQGIASWKEHVQCIIAARKTGKTWIDNLTGYRRKRQGYENGPGCKQRRKEMENLIVGSHLTVCEWVCVCVMCIRHWLNSPSLQHKNAKAPQIDALQYATVGYTRPAPRYPTLHVTSGKISQVLMMQIECLPSTTTSNPDILFGPR